jgi:DNA/RNA-binding domain of Phe-tRNA-synthetase-like protein
LRWDVDKRRARTGEKYMLKIILKINKFNIINIIVEKNDIININYYMAFQNSLF